MLQIPVSEETYARVAEFKQVVEAVLDQGVTLERCAEIVLEQGVDAMIAYLLGAVDPTILLESFQQLGARAPAQVYAYVAEILRRGALKQEQERLRRRIGFYAEPHTQAVGEGLSQAKATPAIVFSRWAPWAERNTLDGLDLPGVYLLAHFDAAPSGPADPMAKQIVYIGATDRSLRDRLSEFNRVALEGKAENHSGGRNYRKTYGDQALNLYVAAMPVELDKKISWWFIQHVESKLLWEFVQKWSSSPPCNRE